VHSLDPPISLQSTLDRRSIQKVSSSWRLDILRYHPLEDEG
jgi:hypothetical protein